MKKLSLVFVSIGVALVVAHAAAATTLASLDEQALTRQASVVVTGRVLSSEAKTDPSRPGVFTEVVIAADEVVAGQAPSGRLLLRERGGSAAGITEHLFGSAEYHPGEHVLVFASRGGDGSLHTSSMAMGKYTIGADGVTATRALGAGVTVLDARSSALIHDPAPQRYALAQLLDSVRATAAHVDAPAADAIQQSEDADAEYSAPFVYLGSPARWFEPDDGLPVIYSIDLTGDQDIGPIASQGAIVSALAAWTDVTTANLELAAGPSISPAPFAGCSTTNQIVFNDPYNEIDDPDNCGGILAIGGFCSSAETRVVNGTEFRRITVGKVVFNNGWGNCAAWNQCNLAEVATHEIGHTIGFGHSSVNSATMAAYAHFDGRCAGLRADDIAAVSNSYPTNMPVHDAVALSAAPVTVKLSASRPVVDKTVRLRVQNGDTFGAGDHFKVTVSDGDCPAGTASTPDFGKAASLSQDTAWLTPGQRKSAKLALSINTSGFSTPDGKTAQRCTLIVTANAQFPDNVDPMPGNNSFPLEVNVIDAADAGQVTLAAHQSFINSVAPISVKLRPGIGQQTKHVKLKVGNADAGEIAGHAIHIETDPGDCPAAAFSAVRFTATQTLDDALVGGGKIATGILDLTINSSQFETLSKLSPTRCTARVTAIGPGGDTNASNDSTELIIDVTDNNDF